jgi:hypothetical protein
VPHGQSSEDLDSPSELVRRPTSDPTLLAVPLAKSKFVTLPPKLLDETSQTFGRDFLFGKNQHNFSKAPPEETYTTYHARHEELKQRAHKKWEDADAKARQESLLGGKMQTALHADAKGRKTTVTNTTKSHSVRPGSSSNTRASSAVATVKKSASPASSTPRGIFLDSDVLTVGARGSKPPLPNAEPTDKKVGERTRHPNNSPSLLSSNKAISAPRLSVVVNNMEGLEVKFS